MIKINGKKVAGIGQPGLNGKSAYETAKEGGLLELNKNLMKFQQIQLLNRRLYLLLFLNLNGLMTPAQ